MQYGAKQNKAAPPARMANAKKKKTQKKKKKKKKKKNKQTKKNQKKKNGAGRGAIGEVGFSTGKHVPFRVQKGEGKKRTNYEGQSFPLSSNKRTSCLAKPRKLLVGARRGPTLLSARRRNKDSNPEQNASRKFLLRLALRFRTAL